MRGSNFLHLLVRIAEADSGEALHRVRLRLIATVRTDGPGCRVRYLLEKLAERERALGADAS